MRPPVRVILITDGDRRARAAVEAAARNLGLRCISASAGNPTRLTGEELVQLVQQAPIDPVLVMVDDRGHPGAGPGEQAAAYLARHPAVRVVGAIAVASDERRSRGVPVACSVTAQGTVTSRAVDKDGQPCDSPILHGDTVDVLRRLCLPVVVGIGDVGKQGGADAPDRGAFLITRAVQEVLARADAFVDRGS